MNERKLEKIDQIERIREEFLPIQQSLENFEPDKNCAQEGQERLGRAWTNLPLPKTSFVG
jgi:hypothetical protein